MLPRALASRGSTEAAKVEASDLPAGTIARRHILANGGRVLNFCSSGKTIAERIDALTSRRPASNGRMDLPARHRLAALEREKAAVRWGRPFRGDAKHPNPGIPLF